MQSQKFVVLYPVFFVCLFCLCSYKKKTLCYLIMRKEIPTTINGNVPFTKIRFIFNYLFVARNLHNQFCPLCSPNAMCTKFFRFEQEKNIPNK